MRDRFRFWPIAAIASVAWSCGSADDTSPGSRPDGGRGGEATTAATTTATSTTAASTTATSVGAGGSAATGGGSGGDTGAAGEGGMGGGQSSGGGGAGSGGVSAGGAGGGRGGDGGGMPSRDGGMAGSAVDAGIAPPRVDGGAAAAMLQDIVCRISGGKPISGTTTIMRRNSDAERQTVRDYATTLLAGMGLTAQSQSYGTGVNLYADLASTTGGTQWIVIGGHYDTVAASPGADDNGSGTAMVLAVADYVARLPKRSKNVVFVLFDQEEEGLIGSGKFADFIQQQQRSVHSAHCFDQIGWDADKDRTVEIERPPADLFALYQSVHDQGGFKMPVTQAMATGSDHDSFRNRNIPSLNISEEYQGGDTTPYHHKIGDTCDTLDYDYMASTLGLVDAVMANLLQ